MSFESWKGSYGFSRPLLRHAQLEEALQTEPEFRAGAKEVTEAQRSIAANAPLAVQNRRDSVCGHIKLASQFCGAHAEFFEFFGEMLTRMDSGQCHDGFILLVVVYNFHISRARRSVGPLEANSPLIVDADAVLSLPIAD